MRLRRGVDDGRRCEVGEGGGQIRVSLVLGMTWGVDLNIEAGLDDIYLLGSQCLLRNTRDLSP